MSEKYNQSWSPSFADEACRAMELETVEPQMMLKPPAVVSPHTMLSPHTIFKPLRVPLNTILPHTMLSPHTILSPHTMFMFRRTVTFLLALLKTAVGET